MTRLELANQLIENQLAFHFAFIPMKNFGFRIADCEICGRSAKSRSQPEQNPKSEIRNPKFVLVPAEGFEPTLSSF